MVGLPEVGILGIQYLICSRANWYGVLGIHTRDKEMLHYNYNRIAL
jgi:hypothetical protein